MDKKMMVAALAIVVILSYILAKRLYSNILNPIFIFVGINVLSIILSLFQKLNFEYTLETTFIIFVMFLSFLVGIVCGIKKRVKYRTLDEKNNYRNNLRNVILLLGFIYDIALIGYLQQLLSSFSIVEFFLSLNEVNAYVQSDEYETHWFSYVIPLGMPLFLLCIFYLKNFNKSPLIVFQTFLSILYCLSPRRDSLFNLIIVSLIFFLSGLQDRCDVKIISKMIARYTLAAVAVIVILMSYSQELLNKANDKTLDLQIGEIPSFLSSPYLYVSLNYPYLQNQNLDYSKFPDVPFLSSFRLGYNILCRIFGIDIDLQSDFELDFINIGQFSTNTAPMLYYSFLDLGVFFFIFFIILGFCSQRAYYLLNSGKVTDRIIGAIYFTLIVLSFRGHLLIYLTFVLSIIYSMFIKLFFLIRKSK